MTRKFIMSDIYIFYSQLTILAILVLPGWHHRFELCTTLQTRRGCHPWRLPKSPGELLQSASYPPAYMTYSYHIPHPWPMGHRAWLRPRGYVWRSLGSTLTLQLQQSTNIGTSSFINVTGSENSQSFDLVKVPYRCDILNAQVEWGIPNFSADHSRPLWELRALFESGPLKSRETYGRGICIRYKYLFSFILLTFMCLFQKDLTIKRFAQRHM